MCGRGDIAVLRACRQLRARVSPAHTASAPLALTHGGQMAVHSTIGLLFLGAGRATLGTTPTAVAALLTAFFPKFPTHSEDNRYHLQAFRHLYVLAVEPRLVLPRDLDTGKLCYAHIQVIDLEGCVKEMKAPCIIPELDTLQEVKINDPRYWPVSFRRDRNWHQLKTFLDYTWCIDIKQRAGCLPYQADPHGFRTLLAQTLTLDRTITWAADTLALFTSDERVTSLVGHYLEKEVEGGGEERRYKQALSMVTRECVVRDVMCVLPIWTTFLKIIKTMESEPTSYHMWQIKLLLSQIEHHNKRVLNEMKIDGQDGQSEPLISSEFTLAIKQRVTNILDTWEMKVAPYLRKYIGLPSSRTIGSCEENLKKILTSFIVYHDLPRSALENVVVDTELSLLVENNGLSAGAVSCISESYRRLLCM